MTKALMLMMEKC